MSMFERLAGRDRAVRAAYAQHVVDVLAPAFSDLREPRIADMVITSIERHLRSPDPAWEVFLDSPHVAAVLAEPAWADRRGLTPLFWGHVRPYGEVKLNLASRLEIGRADLDGLDTAGGSAP